MNFKLLKLIFISTNLIAFTQSQACPTYSKRREIRELSLSERTTFFNAIKTIRNFGGVDLFSQSCSTHYSYQASAHGVPAFLPWHREYLRRYELALQKVDASIVLPFWDWSKDSQKPELSPVLGPDFFGGNGRSNDSCVTTGQFANFKVTIPNQHCLMRDYDGGSYVSALYSTEAIETIIQKSLTFDQFRRGIEGSPHGSVHMNIGGDYGDFSTMYSPNDPIFYLHHTFIDMLWAEWQARNPTIANPYDGKVGSRTVTSNDVMSPFGIKVSQVLNTKAFGYCYYYDRWSYKVPTTKTLTSATTLKRRALIDINVQADLDLVINPKFDSLIDSTLRKDLKSGKKYKRVKVSPGDRKSKKKIRTPKPLSEAYIKRNNLNLENIRQTEAELALITELLNADDSYVPYE